jgi:hypothetical protein
MSLLITASLLNSWDWYLKSSDDRSDAALAELVTTLKREPIPDNEAMMAGRAFEDAVTSFCTNGIEPPDDSFGDCVREVAEYCRGRIFQFKSSKPATIAGEEYLLYGRIDVFGGPWIDDIKFGQNFDVGKYRDSAQTKMYLELEDGPIGMRYLFSDGSSVWIDEYRREDIGSIIPVVREFRSWIRAFPEYESIYIDKWQSYG